MANAKLVTKWIVDGFQPYHFKEINVELSGSSSIGDGFIGDIGFAKVFGERTDQGKEKFNVALKYGKNSTQLREKLPVAELFKNEIFLYNTLVPAYRKLEKASNCCEIDGFTAICFNTLMYDGQEVLLLENLKSIGYELHDSLKPLNVDHLKLTFEKYGKFHALGMAYREKYPDKFNQNKLTFRTRMIGAFSFLAELFNVAEETAFSVLETKGELILLDRLRKEIPVSFSEIIYDFIQIDEQNSTIIHGDCWNNNFMFKYEEENKSKPVAVKFLDFQIPQTVSPVYDLSYHIYVTASETELKEFSTLLRVYHNSLSTYLNQLGFSSEKLFPFSELERQWEKYSLYGVIMALMALPFALADKEDAVDFGSTDESKVKSMYKQVEKKKLDLFAPRLLSTLTHYFKCQKL